jgi:MerR family transcriptional regulator, redox-sensitive transcriptional activator SoxR
MSSGREGKGLRLSPVPKALSQRGAPKSCRWHLVNMASGTIGELARQTGTAASALRYYEKSGLLASPVRVSNRRQYNPDVLGRLRIILLARDAGFSVSETRSFLNGYPVGIRPATRWRAMAKRKLAEFDELTMRAGHMRALLFASFNCESQQLQDCERLIAAKACCSPESSSPAVSAGTRLRLGVANPGKRIKG